MAGRSAELGLVKAALKKMAPVQMMVRCQFCAKNISGRDDEIGGAHLGVRVRISLSPAWSRMRLLLIIRRRPAPGGYLSEVQ